MRFAWLDPELLPKLPPWTLLSLEVDPDHDAHFYPSLLGPVAMSPLGIQTAEVKLRAMPDLGSQHG